MRLISASVTKSLFAMRSIRSRPRAASRLKPDAVIEPSGNANLAATESLRGESESNRCRSQSTMPNHFPKPSKASVV
jgi:hypothetical protein